MTTTTCTKRLVLNGVLVYWGFEWGYQETVSEDGSEMEHVPVAYSDIIGHMGTEVGLLRDDVDGLVGKMSNTEAFQYRGIPAWW